MARVTRFLHLDDHEFTWLEAVHNPGAGRIVDHPLIVAIRRRHGLVDFARR